LVFKLRILIVAAQDHRKLTFIYLANDVVQNSRRKGPELGKAFAPTLKKALEHMGKIGSDSTKQNLLRILGIWKERGIYEAPLMDDFQKTYLNSWGKAHSDQDDVEYEYIAGITTPPTGTVTTENAIGTGGQEPGPSAASSSSKPQRLEKKKHKKSHKRKKEKEISKKNRKPDSNANKTVEEWETDGVIQREVSRAMQDSASSMHAQKR